MSDIIYGRVGTDQRAERRIGPRPSSSRNLPGAVCARVPYAPPGRISLYRGCGSGLRMAPACAFCPDKIVKGRESLMNPAAVTVRT